MNHLKEHVSEKSVAYYTAFVVTATLIVRVIWG